MYIFCITCRHYAFLSRTASLVFYFSLFRQAASAALNAFLYKRKFARIQDLLDEASAGRFPDETRTDWDSAPLVGSPFSFYLPLAAVSCKVYHIGGQCIHFVCPSQGKGRQPSLLYRASNRSKVDRPQ